MWFRFAVAACLVSVSGAPSALAECFAAGTARQPMSATFADGAKVDILERSAQSIRYTSKSSPTAAPIELSAYGGLFTLYAQTPTTRFAFDWQDDLSKLFPLRVGQKASVKADIKGDPPRVFAISFEVVGAETVRIGACDYPVLKVVQTSGDVGKATVTINRYVNPDSQLTLRTERVIPATATEPAKTITNQMIALE